MSERVYARGYVQRAEGDSSAPVRFVAATEGMKGDGLDLRMDTLDLSRFQSNPIVLYGHDGFGRENLPIGRATSTAVEGANLLTTVEFDADDEFASTVERKVRAGYLNAVSVGFDIEDIDRNGVVGAWSLFEVSVVPIPMDPAAIAQSRQQQDMLLARGLRAGKVLSSANRAVVAEARDRLTEVLTASDGESDDSSDTDDDERSVSALAARQRRQQLHEAL